MLKGAHDGLGGTLKREASKYSLPQPYDHQIQWTFLNSVREIVLESKLSLYLKNLWIVKRTEFSEGSRNRKPLKEPEGTIALKANQTDSLRSENSQQV